MTVTTNAQNPFFEKFNTPHETMPFDRITTAYIEEALVEGVKRHEAEVDAIANSTEAPTFENTILAIENAGALLDRVGTVFGNLQSAETNDELRELSKKMAPMLSDHQNNVSLNEKLFARIKAVYENSANLNMEQKKLTEDYYRSFVNRGADLTGDAREKYRELTKKLNLLKIQFSEKNLNATNEYALVLKDEAQLAGLPESAVAAAKAAAKERGEEGWVITLQAPSYVPFMKYS
jgi:peptidyl-dipeptidase Dcp